MMRHTCGWIIFLAFIAGCGSSANQAPPEKTRVYIQDLSPPETRFAEPVAVFELFAFYFSEQQFPAVLAAIEEVCFPVSAEQTSFGQCGIRLYKGRAENFEPLTVSLEQTAGGFAGSGSLLMGLNAPMTIQSAPVPAGRLMEQSRKGVGPKGSLGWSVLPRLADISIERILVKLGPVYEPYVFPAWPDAEKFRQRIATDFSCGFVETEMATGDFVALMPMHGQKDQKTDLEALLFAYPQRPESDKIILLRFLRVEQ